MAFDVLMIATRFARTLFSSSLNQFQRISIKKRCLLGAPGLSSSFQWWDSCTLHMSATAATKFIWFSGCLVFIAAWNRLRMPAVKKSDSNERPFLRFKWTRSIFYAGNELWKPLARVHHSLQRSTLENACLNPLWDVVLLGQMYDVPRIMRRVKWASNEWLVMLHSIKKSESVDKYTIARIDDRLNKLPETQKLNDWLISMAPLFLHEMATFRII